MVNTMETEFFVSIRATLADIKEEGTPLKETKLYQNIASSLAEDSNSRLLYKMVADHHWIEYSMDSLLRIDSHSSYETPKASQYLHLPLVIGLTYGKESYRSFRLWVEKTQLGYYIENEGRKAFRERNMEKFEEVCTIYATSFLVQLKSVIETLEQKAEQEGSLKKRLDKLAFERIWSRVSEVKDWNLVKRDVSVVESLTKVGAIYESAKIEKVLGNIDISEVKGKPINLYRDFALKAEVYKGTALFPEQLEQSSNILAEQFSCLYTYSSEFNCLFESLGGCSLDNYIRKAERESLNVKLGGFSLQTWDRNLAMEIIHPRFIEPTKDLGQAAIDFLDHAFYPRIVVDPERGTLQTL